MSGPRASAYPAFRLAVLVAVGIVIGRYWGPSSEALILLLAVLSFLALALGVLRVSGNSSHVAPTVSVSVLGILGGLTLISLADSRTVVVPQAEREESVIVSGIIVEEPRNVGQSVRFILREGEIADTSGTIAIPSDILVTVKYHKADSLRPPLRYGLAVALQGTLSRPRLERNPGEFNPRHYYEANGISMLLFVRGAAHMVVMDTSGGTWYMRKVIQPVRKRATELIERTVVGREAGVLKGLLLGDRSGIDASTRQAFAASGVAHVLAVSGAHVAIIAGILYFALSLLRIPRVVRGIIAGVALVHYMLLTGSNPPVVRATIMALVMLLGIVAQERTNGYNALGLAALILLGIDARQLFDVGFQLSFAAVLAIMYLYPRANDWISRLSGPSIPAKAGVWVLRVAAVSLVATLGTLPFAAIHFGRISVVGIIANVVVLPAISLSIVMGFVSLLCGIVSTVAAEAYGAVNQLLLSLTLRFIDFSGGLSFATIDTSRFTILDAFPFYAGLGLISNLGEATMVRRFTIVFLLALNAIVYVPGSVAHTRPVGRMRLSFIDVGQGDAILAEFPDGRTMLVDAGPSAVGYDAGMRVVAPFLRRRGISVIDYLVVTHPHGDHLGGVPSILEEFQVDMVIESGQAVRSGIYSRYLDDLQLERCIVQHVSAGVLIREIPSVRAYVIYPSPSVLADTLRSLANLNNTSVAIKLQFGSISCLFVGDAEAEAESEMLNAYGDFLESTILKAGHHGSKTSSTQSFLDVVRPAHVVVSVGAHNKFRHPSPVVINRLHNMHADVIRTDEEGAVIFETDGRTLSRVDWR